MITGQKPSIIFQTKINNHPSLDQVQQNSSLNKSPSQQIIIKNIDSGSYEVFNIQEVDSIPLSKDLRSAQTRVSLWNSYWDQMAKNDVKLLKIVLNKDVKRLKKILTQEPIQLNSFRYIDGWSLLHHAVLSSSQQIIKILVQHKIDLNMISNQMKRTALHQAVLSNKINNVQILVKYNANPNIQDIDGNTPAHYAADLSYTNIFQILLDSQIDLNFSLKNNQQMTIIDSVRDKHVFQMIQQQYPSAIHQNQNQKLIFQHRRVVKLATGQIISRPTKSDTIQKFLHLNPNHYSADKNSIFLQKPDSNSIKQSVSSQSSSNGRKKHNMIGKRPSNWIQKKGKLIASQSLHLMKQSVLDPEENQPQALQSLANFQILRFVGSGGFAQVFLARKKKSSKLFALKRIYKSKILENNLKRYVYSQRNIMIKCQHPFIVQAESMFQDQIHLYIAMEYCECGDLLRLLSLKQKFSEYQTKLYAGQVGLALQYMHKKNILFRDLKAANVLIEKDGYVKVSDFGLAKQSMISFTFLGSVQYLAPEMVVDSQMKQHTKSIDWYLFGVLIYEMLTGRPPFYAQKQQIVFKKIRQQKPVFPNYLSKDCQNLLSKLLEKDPSKRIGSQKDFEQIKNEQWFRQINFEKLYRKQYQMPKVQPTIKQSDLRKKIPIDNYMAQEKYQHFKQWNYSKKKQIN